VGRGRGVPSLGTSEARRALPTLVKEASSRQHPSRSLTDNAIEIRPRGQEGSASLVPTIDIEAAEERIAALERERGELEEDLEDAGIALLIHERLQSTSGKRLTATEFLNIIGMEEFVAELPQR